MSSRRYEVLAMVGEGGMGAVYHARLRGAGAFEKEVALKILVDEGLSEADDMARRLRDEARILGMIRHRAVVAVDGLVRLSDRWAVVMEYIDGVDLLEIREHSGALPVGVALEVVAEVAGALHAAFHATGPEGRPLSLMHRDIKPGNIRITTTGDVKVLDFGVAKGDFAGREAETRQASFGSLGYVPQERIDGIESPKGDVYALGVVLYEMLSGERYGQTQLSPGRHERQLAERLKLLEERSVPPHVLDLLAELMAFEPDDRPDPRDIERRALDLRAGIPDVRMRDWAEANIRQIQIVSRNTLPSAGLTGQVLAEEDGDGARGDPMSQPLAPSSPAQLAIAGALALVVTLILALGAVAVATVGILIGRAL
ncbi:MAG TPA: serine/threonine protein kinase [Deltaproteobacteria bacterium]|nr:serine/threonine protein kinase [Deltaproteobacteria bacterium]